MKITIDIDMLAEYMKAADYDGSHFDGWTAHLADKLEDEYQIDTLVLEQMKVLN